MMYEYGMLLRYFLVWESESLTDAEEYWEAESFISAGDEEYVYLQPCLEHFHWGITIFYLRKLCGEC